MNDRSDDLAAARGVMLGTAIGLIMWLLGFAFLMTVAA